MNNHSLPQLLATPPKNKTIIECEVRVPGGRLELGRLKYLKVEVVEADSGTSSSGDGYEILAIWPWNDCYQLIKTFQDTADKITFAGTVSTLYCTVCTGQIHASGILF